MNLYSVQKRGWHGRDTHHLRRRQCPRAALRVDVSAPRATRAAELSHPLLSSRIAARGDGNVTVTVAGGLQRRIRVYLHGLVVGGVVGGIGGDGRVGSHEGASCGDGGATLVSLRHR